MKHIKYFPVVFLLMISGACHVDEAGHSMFKIGVDEELTMDLVQTLHLGMSGLEVSFVSHSPYDCGGAGYDYSFYTTTEYIEIHLQSVVLPQPCINGPAPAREQITLPNQPGTYAVILVIGDLIQNTGTLEIDTDGYKLTMHQVHGISLNHDQMYKIPDHTIWGYVYHADHQYEAQQIFQAFFDPITDDAELQQGYYGFFQSFGANSVQLTLPSLKVGAKSFAYQYNGNSASLAADVASLKQQLPEGTEMKVFSWTGSTY